MMSAENPWPSLPLDAWEDTFATLHRWMQIVGKIRLAQTPWINHSWHVPLYVTARGLTTSPIPHGARSFEITFDFLEHQLLIEATDGKEAAFTLRAMSVAVFYRELLSRLGEMGLAVSIHGRPNELADATPFAEDRSHRSYDPVYATRFWHVLVQADRVLQQFRARFIGKCSPVHFFWGSFDLAVTRFSGRPAPPHPGGIPNLPDWIVREAYSHEVSSCGFWPGGAVHPFPLFYSYAYPEPEGFSSAVVEPHEAFYSKDLREWVLPYDAVRQAASPDDTLLAFLETTYASAAELGHWDRATLERHEEPGPGG
ncbi:MAG: DUF5996 family protein [Gemmatimonadales bacterium]